MAGRLSASPLAGLFLLVLAALADAVLRR